jgi:hypothetical protein
MSTEPIPPFRFLDPAAFARRSFPVQSVDKVFLAHDRSKLEIRLVGAEGAITVSLSISQLDALISTLQNVEYAASLHDPLRGPLPGEEADVRACFVDGHQIGRSAINGAPCVVVGLQSSQVVRWFAMDEQKASELQGALPKEIPKLQLAPRAN